MRLKETILLVEEKDVIEITNRYLNSNGFKLKKINFLKQTDSIEIIGSIKKVFSVEFKCSLKLIESNNKMINLRINDLKALRVNLFSVIEKFVSEKGDTKLRDKGIEIKGKDITLNLESLMASINFTAFSIKNIEIVDTGIVICLDKISIDFKELSMFKEDAKEINIDRIIK